MNGKSMKAKRKGVEMPGVGRGNNPDSHKKGKKHEEGAFSDLQEKPESHTERKKQMSLDKAAERVLKGAKKYEEVRSKLREKLHNDAVAAGALAKKTGSRKDADVAIAAHKKAAEELRHGGNRQVREWHESQARIIDLMVL